MGKKRIFVWSAAAAVVAAAFRLSFPASAAVTDIIQLTVEQTVALYGDTVQSQYYTNSNSWADCTFTYIGSTSGLATDGVGNLSTAGYVQNDISLLFGSNWVWYGCPAASLSNIKVNDVSFQFRFQPSINIRGIAYFRQILASVRNAQHGTGLDPWRSEYRAACTVSYSPSPVAVYARGLDMSSTDSAANVYFTPSPLQGRPLGEVFPNVFSSAHEVAFCDMYLQNIDATTGQENTFDFTGLTYRPTRCPAVTCQVEVSDNTFQNEDYYLFALSCPRVTDGYVMPDLPTTSADYSGQLDDIISQGAANQTLLQQILAKLNLIYAQMQINNDVSISSSSITAIVDGIKGLFVPTQSDILNFRLSMMTLCNDTLSPFYDVEQLRDTAINRIVDAPLINYVDLPLVDLTGAGVDFKMTASDFPDYQVIDNNVRVPLKAGSDWSFFYDLVAWGIDVICTLAFVNMVINKLHAFFLGDKVVEIDDN